MILLLEISKTKTIMVFNLNEYASIMCFKIEIPTIVMQHKIVFVIVSFSF